MAIDIDTVRGGSKLRPTPFFSDKFNRAWVVFIAAFITIVGLIYFWSGERAEDLLAEQMLHREQVIARAGARSIESFFELLGAQVATFSTRQAIVSQNLEDSRAALDLFMQKWAKTPVSGIVLLDKDGKVLVTANRLGTQEAGTDLSDRDYFVWARGASQSEVYVTESMVSRMGASKGKYVVVVASPVVENGQFQGVLAAAVVLPELAEAYLNPLKISEKSQTYLLNDEGVLLSGSQGQLVGQNFIKYLEENPFAGSDIFVDSLKKRLVVAFEQREGKLDYLRNSLEDKTAIKRWLLSYSAVNLQDRGLSQPEGKSSQRWLLAMETPAEDALLYFGPFGLSYATSMVIVVLIIVIFSLFLILVRRYTQRKSFLEGFAAGRDKGGNEKPSNS